MASDGRQYGGARGRSGSSSTSSPFSDEHSPPATAYPPQQARPLLATTQPESGPGRHVRLDEESQETMNQAFRQYDAVRAQTYPVGGAGRGGVQMPMPGDEGAGMSMPPSHGNSRSGSWDLLAGMRKFEHGYEQFDSRNASQAHLTFADGDVPKNKVRFWHRFAAQGLW